MRILVCVLTVIATAACSSSSSETQTGPEVDASSLAGNDAGKDASIATPEGGGDDGSCRPKTTAYCPSDWACGEFSDGCGGTVYCGTSTPTGCSSDAYSQCGVVTPNKCSSCQAGGSGTCATGESTYTCPSLDSLPDGCHVVGRDVDAGIAGYACCVTK